jgi:protein-S-isoprenylcysteine O-methyltransferase Ste14
VDHHQPLLASEECLRACARAGATATASAALPTSEPPPCALRLELATLPSASCGPGGRLLDRLIPGPHGQTLATTTYATLASAQLLALFALWTPSGIIWFRAEGAIFWAICAAFAASWLILLKASFDAGAEVQSGALGWMSLLARIRPVFPDMPTQGLFRLIRQPIYVAFAMTLWTVPVWTPDQLMLAVCFTAYCLLAPRLKERRFAARYGDRFTQYQAGVPYMLPRLPKEPPDAQ